MHTMDSTKKVFWREAIKGGTIIGLVGIAFAMLKYTLRPDELSTWLTIVQWVDIVVFIALIYAFTKKISRSAGRAHGFSYNRCIGFVLAMMLFYGFLSGVFSAIFNNFIDPEGAMRVVDEYMVSVQDMLQGEQFDLVYRWNKTIVFNPIWNVLGGILGGVVGGLIVGLISSAFTQRKPDIFAEPDEENTVK